MSWLLSPISATKITAKLTRTAFTGTPPTRRRKHALDRATVGNGCRSKVSFAPHIGTRTAGAHHPACRPSGEELLPFAVEQGSGGACAGNHAGVSGPC